jgi:charged multivesicular body protein 6
MKVLDSLKVGNQSLKEVQKLFSLEDIEKIMDETIEGIEKQNVCTFHHSFLTYILNCC